MQTTDTLLMIEPVAFGYNAETAKNNYFQVNDNGNDTQKLALDEFNRFVNKLRDKGIKVITVKDTIDPPTPDSIFPNNWVSFGEDAKAMMYPMFAKNRRDERRIEILEEVKKAGYQLDEIGDWTQYENENQFLEGTGSMIFDHDNKIAYGSVSLRLDENLFRKFCQENGYKPVVFHSYQSYKGKRVPIYHTNVMMCVADQYAVICLACIDDIGERQYVSDTLRDSGKEIIEISEEQMQNFAGNMLQVNNHLGKKFLIMSQSALDSLSQEQIQRIESYNEIIAADLHTIEKNGGGSARCMLAEVFLPQK